MKFGIALSNSGTFGDPREAMKLAATAEQAGWDGYFSWDALPTRADPPPSHDPWVILSSVAAVTERIRIGTCIAVVPRYGVHVLARTLASLDVLSNGRLIFGVGLGDRVSSTAIGDTADDRVRAEKLDEALDVITRLWSGEEVNHRGKHFVVDSLALTATPIQERVPIWVGGDSAGALRRAARWDGWIGPSEDPMAGSADGAAAVVGRLTDLRASGEGFDVAWAGVTRDDNDYDSVSPYRQAGATWWIEMVYGSRDDVLRRVSAGPPRTAGTGE